MLLDDWGATSRAWKKDDRSTSYESIQDPTAPDGQRHTADITDDQVLEIGRAGVGNPQIGNTILNLKDRTSTLLQQALIETILGKCVMVNGMTIYELRQRYAALTAKLKKETVPEIAA